MNKEVRPKSNFSYQNNEDYLKFSERPKTPSASYNNYEGEYQRMLAENITGYITSTDSKKEEELMNSLLPRDVNYYYREDTKVTDRINELFTSENTNIEEIFDDFLKKVILICEEKKKEANQLLMKDKTKLNAFYESFKNEIRNFLMRSQNQLSEATNEISTEENDSQNDFSNPLEFHMKKLRLQRDQMDKVETTIKSIYNNYNNTKIPNIKRNIDLILQEDKGDKKTDFQKTSVNKSILKKNLDLTFEKINSELNGLFNSKRVEVESVPMSMRSSIHEKLMEGSNFKERVQSPNINDVIYHNQQMAIRNKSMNRPSMQSDQKSFNEIPVPRPTSYENSKNTFLNLNLENSMTKYDRIMTNNSLAPITENNFSNSKYFKNNASDSVKMKSSNISININNQPFNHNNYINIYNHTQAQFGSVKRPTNNLAVTNPSGVRPNSVHVSTMESNHFSKPYRPASSIKELPSISETRDQILSITKTNIVNNKLNIPSSCQTFNIVDSSSKHNITCFDIDNSKNLLYYGTADGQLVKCLLSDKTSVKSSTSVRLPAKILFIKIIDTNNIVVGTTGNLQNLLLIDAVSLKTTLIYKTYNESLKLMTFFNKNVFLVISEDDKLMLYMINQISAKKTFKISSSKLVDICMPSHKLFFAATDNGDIKIIKSDFDKLTLTMDVYLLGVYQGRGNDFVT